MSSHDTCAAMPNNIVSYHACKAECISVSLHGAMFLCYSLYVYTLPNSTLSNSGFHDGVQFLFILSYYATVKEK